MRTEVYTNVQTDKNCHVTKIVTHTCLDCAAQLDVCICGNRRIQPNLYDLMEHTRGTAQGFKRQPTLQEANQRNRAVRKLAQLTRIVRFMAHNTRSIT